MLNCDILKEITFIDTPGVLSGSKQRYGRAYDFSTIAGWTTRIVLLTAGGGWNKQKGTTRIVLLTAGNRPPPMASAVFPTGVLHPFERPSGDPPPRTRLALVLAHLVFSKSTKDSTTINN